MSLAEGGHLLLLQVLVLEQGAELLAQLLLIKTSILLLILGITVITMITITIVLQPTMLVIRIMIAVVIILLTIIITPRPAPGPATRPARCTPHPKYRRRWPHGGSRRGAILNNICCLIF